MPAAESVTPAAASGGRRCPGPRRSASCPARSRNGRRRHAGHSRRRGPSRRQSSRGNRYRRRSGRPVPRHRLALEPTAVEATCPPSAAAKTRRQQTASFNLSVAPAEEAVVARLRLGKDGAAVGNQQPDTGPRPARRRVLGEDHHFVARTSEQDLQVVLDQQGRGFQRGAADVTAATPAFRPSGSGTGIELVSGLYFA